MKIKYFVYILIALLLGYMIYNRINSDSKKSNSSNPSNSKSSKSSTAFNAIIIKEVNFDNSVSVSGSIEANEQVQIRSEISGLIRSINFEEGSIINKGQLLIKIDDRELQAQLAQALTKEKLAAEIEDRSKKLLKSEAISQEEYDNVNAEYKSLQAQTQLIRVQLSKTEIRAPFSGKIGLRNVSTGAYITPTTDIANLVSINPIKLNFSVPEKYASRIKKGQKLSFNVEGSLQNFSAEIYAIEPTIDATTRTLILKAKANNNSGTLLPGTFANINLPLESISNAILVPSEAVIPVLKGKQLYITENGKVKPVLINSDIRTDKDILVSSGLKVGDTVLTSGMMSLKPGDEAKVTIVKQD